MTSLVTVYDAVGCFNPQKDDISSWLLVGVHTLLFFCDRCGGDKFFYKIFFRFWSRWPMVVAMYLSRYLVTYSAVNISHDIIVFNRADPCRRYRYECGGVLEPNNIINGASITCTIGSWGELFSVLAFHWW